MTSLKARRMTLNRHLNDKVTNTYFTLAHAGGRHGYMVVEILHLVKLKSALTTVHLP